MFSNNLAPKFLLPVSLLIMFTSFSLFFFFIRHETATIKSERINYSDSLARNLAYNSEYGALTKNIEILHNLVNGVFKEKDVIAVIISGDNGDILINEGKKQEPCYESSAPIITKKLEMNRKNAATADDNLLFSEKNKEEGKEEVIGQVTVFTSLVDMQNKLNEVKRRIIDITLIVIVIAIAITFLLVRKITSPLKELVLATKIISDGDLTHKVRVATTDEIGKLSVSFNKMTEELSRTVVSKDYVDNIIKSMIDTLIVTNPDATIRNVNQATMNLLGYSENELVGKPVGMLFTENSETRLSGQKPWIDSLIDEGMIQNTEATYIAKDGTRIPVILSGSVMKSDNENIQGFVYIALDITERKRAEEMVRQSEERYRNLVETAPDIIYSLSIENGAFISLNPAFESVTGWKRADWIGKKFS